MLLLCDMTNSILNLNHHHLQTLTLTSSSFTMSSSSYTLLDSQLPIAGLGQAVPVPLNVFQAVSSEMTGNALSLNILHFSLGLFFIDVNLVEQHPTQRVVSSGYVNKLMSDFEKSNILRTGSPGVVIGLGEGWNALKNTGGVMYRITDSSPCLELLRTSPGGPIAQVI